ncbi:MAG TPA: Virginiamycin B lyase [Ktedonobacteraceae bacterium]|nr:Virginiamycin B lyase [Ktedonobacteraceae bacterium]
MVSNFCPHRGPLRNVLLLLFLAGLVSACGASITSSSSPTPNSTQGIRGIFHEYALPPSQFVPFTITAGPDGNLWFTERMQNQNGSVQAGKIARFTPTGTLSEFSLPSATPSATDIITGPDGNLWFTEGDKIARITPMGKISEFPVPSATSITTGSDGNLWFTEQSKIGRMTLTGKVSEFSLPFHQYPAGPSPKGGTAGSAQGEPLAITAGPDGNLWFTEILQNGGSSIGRITTAGKITEFPLSSANTLLSSITAGSDGNLWFTETGGHGEPSKIGVITPQGKIREFILSPSIIPGGITRGPDGNLWFTEFQYDETGTTAGQIGRITTAGKISDYPLPTASNSPTSITFGADHTLWFIEVEVTPTNPNGKNGKIGHLV